MLDILLDMLPFLLTAAAVLLALYVLVRYLTSARARGRRGKKKVDRLLRSCMREGDRLVSDVMLVHPQSGMSAQIDHVLLSTRGLFVIETKNLTGDIIGSDGDGEWARRFENGRYGKPFLSPVRQNMTHIRTLKAVTQTGAWAENLVVFVQGNIGHIKSEHVFSLRGLKIYLGRAGAHPLPAAERDRIYEILLGYKEHPPVSRARHRRNVRKSKRR